MRCSRRRTPIACRERDVCSSTLGAVFDDHEAACDWLSTPNPALSGHSPLSLLATDAGASRVDDVLTRLEFGVYA